VRCVRGADRGETVESECANDERPKDAKECSRDRCPPQRPQVGALISTETTASPSPETPYPFLSYTTATFLSETTKHPIHWATGPWTEVLYCSLFSRALLSEFFQLLTGNRSNTPQLNVSRCKNPEFIVLSSITSYNLNPFLVNVLQ
jgi:hypothetical protein